MRFLLLLSAFASLVLARDPATVTPQPSPSVREKWDHFTRETFAPFTLAAGGFNATFSQLTQSAPLYGRNWKAYPDRFGASVADNVSQNFFEDFVLASALREDTRYVRLGSSHRMWMRVGYALSRAVIVRRNEGGETFNLANVGGSAISAALSNLYYPPASRTPSGALVNWSTNIAGSGLANLLPEFWPDFSAWLTRHQPFHRRH